LGPYREGFGTKSFTTLLNCVDLRIWSKYAEGFFDDFHSQVKNALKRYALSLDETKDIFVQYTCKIRPIKSHTRPLCETHHGDFDPLDIQLFKSFLLNKKLGIVTGIGRPEELYETLQNILNINHFQTFAFPDHGGDFHRIQKYFIQKCEAFLMTLKDFYRWSHEESFQEFVKTHSVFIIENALTMVNCKGDYCLLSDQINRIIYGRH